MKQQYSQKLVQENEADASPYAVLALYLHHLPAGKTNLNIYRLKGQFKKVEH